VLFKQRFWAGLADGSVTVTFRRWRRPQARPGGHYRTPAGVLEVTAVDVVDPATISDADVGRSGYRDRAELRRDLDRHPNGEAYRIEFRYSGRDPRATLRADAEIPDDELDRIAARLDRFDRTGRDGPWTQGTLRVIAERPAVRAGDLAAALGRDRLAFKRDVRKLKELGLTESLEVGYRLSPRGRVVLDRLAGPPPPPAPTPSDQAPAPG
jgi:hypothetical protein